MKEDFMKCGDSIQNKQLSSKPGQKEYKQTHTPSYKKERIFFFAFLACVCEHTFSGCCIYWVYIDALILLMAQI